MYNHIENLCASRASPESRYLGSDRRSNIRYLVQQQPQDAEAIACQDSQQLHHPSLDVLLHGSGKSGPELDCVPEQIVLAWPC